MPLLYAVTNSSFLLPVVLQLSNTYPFPVHVDVTARRRNITNVTMESFDSVNVTLWEDILETSLTSEVYAQLFYYNTVSVKNDACSFLNNLTQFLADL